MSDSTPGPDILSVSVDWGYTVGVLILLSTVAVSTILFAVYALSLSVGSPDPGIFVVNVFGTFIALMVLFLAFYVQFGPRIPLPFTPVREPPAHIPITLFVLACGILMTNLRFATTNYYTALFWRVVGHSIILALATGLAATFTELQTPEWASEYEHDRDRDRE